MRTSWSARLHKPDENRFVIPLSGNDRVNPGKIGSKWNWEV